MEKVIIYGIGTYGEQAYNFFHTCEEFKIVGVGDSDINKIGTKFHEYGILSPENVFKQDYDFVLLCMARWDQALIKMHELNIDTKKIRVWDGKIKELVEVGTKCVHSQDGEDLFLSERFAGVNDGVYVDVGAYHPIRFSNTFWAYKRGWRGINIEPNPDGIAVFDLLRPTDININCGVSNVCGNMQYYKFREAALNTFNYERVKYLEKLDYKVEGVIRVPVVPLQSILDKYSISKINFLDIDVEDNELEVLQGLDFDKVDIDLILVEQLDMNLQEIIDSSVAKLLLQHGYMPKQKLNRTVIYEK